MIERTRSCLVVPSRLNPNPPPVASIKSCARWWRPVGVLASMRPRTAWAPERAGSSEMML
jgi:hypothetical protein